MTRNRRAAVTSVRSVDAHPWNISIGKVRGTGHVAEASRVRTMRGGVSPVNTSSSRSRMAQVRPVTANMARPWPFAPVRITSLAASTLAAQCPLMCSGRRSRTSSPICTRFSGLLPRKASPALCATWPATLILAVLSPQTLQVVQVGDGAVVVQSAESLRCLSKGAPGEFVNEATFLTAADALSSAQTSHVSAHDLQTVALMTDGVQHLGIGHGSDEPFAGFFQPLFDYVHSHEAAPSAERNRELDAFLDSSQVNAETDDDRRW